MRTTYDGNFIYFAFTGFDSTFSHVIKTLKRDTKVGEGEVIGLVLDPNNAGAND